MQWMEFERSALVATARHVDPDQPTLCEGWTVRHLLAHLVQRQYQPVRFTVDLAGRRPPGKERFLSRLVATASSPDGYQHLVDRFARKGPRWHPLTWFGDRANLLEYVVHHEDIRRAATPPAAPRVLPVDFQQAVWHQLLKMARVAFRSSDVGVVLRQPQGPSELVRRGPDPVTVSGSPVELVLYAFGRRDAAQVHIDGSSASIARLVQ